MRLAEHFVTSWTSITPKEILLHMKLFLWKFIFFGDFQPLSLGGVV